MRTIFSIVIVPLLLICNFNIYSQNQNIYVSPDGKDDNIGTKQQPLKTLEKALDKISYKSTTIFLRAGQYSIKRGIIINENKNKVIIQSYKDEKVYLSGGIIINNNDFKKLNNINNDSIDSVKKEIYVVDLNKYNISEIEEIKKTGYSAAKVPYCQEVFCNLNTLSIAAWPNKNTLMIGEVLKTTNNKELSGPKGFKYLFERKINWVSKDDIWIEGIFAVGWAYDNIKLKNIDTTSHIIYLKDSGSYGIYSNNDESNENIKYAKNSRGFRFYNILEELDTKGEYFIDKDKKKLYIYPFDIKKDKIEVSQTSLPIFKIVNSDNITIRNINFINTRGLFIDISNSNKINIDMCSFINSGLQAIKAEQCTKINISRSTISNSGAGGIIINGGDRKTLSPSNNLIYNCEFYNYSRLYKSYSPAIDISGVKCTVSNCYIHDAPDQAIIFSGNDHIIANNKIENICTDFTDMGGIYTGRDPSSTGTIIKNNYFQNIRNSNSEMIAAVYVDDGSGGIDISGNIFENCGSKQAKGFGAIHINGGSNNSLNNNVMINCGVGYSMSNWTDEKWVDTFIKNKKNFDMLTKYVDIRSQLYIEKYPYLKNFFDTTQISKRENIINNSLYYGIGKFSIGKGYIIKNNKIDDQNYVNDFNKKKLYKISKVNYIDINSIGLVKKIKNSQN